MKNFSKFRRNFAEIVNPGAIHFHRQTEGARCVLVEDGGESTLPRLDLFFVSRYSSYFLQIFLVTFLANIHQSMFGLVW